MRDHQKPNGEESDLNFLGLTFAFIAALLLVGTGMILGVYGVGGLISDVGRSTDIVFRIGPKAWSMIHAFGGVAFILAGYNIVLARSWARLFGLGVAALALVAGLLSLEAYTFWAVGLIVLNACIIWALALHWNDTRFLST